MVDNITVKGSIWVTCVRGIWWLLIFGCFGAGLKVIGSDPFVVWQSAEFQGRYGLMCGVWYRVGRDVKRSWRVWYRICVVFWCDNLWGVISLLGVWHGGVFLGSGNYYMGDWLGRAIRFEDIWRRFDGPQELSVTFGKHSRTM